MCQEKNRGDFEEVCTRYKKRTNEYRDKLVILQLKRIIRSYKSNETRVVTYVYLQIFQWEFKYNPIMPE